MSAHRILIEFQERAAAHQAAAILEQLFEPAPDAVTVFKNQDSESNQSADRWQIEAYFTGESQNAAESDSLCASVATSLSVAESQISIAPVPDKNWVALSQAALPPVHAGRFTIFGSHDRDTVALGPHSILIDAGEAFGTAHHATTYGCLLAIESLARQYAVTRALDLGCGSAVLAIALARTQPAATILASDSDRQSIVVARQNIHANRVSHHVRALHAFGLADPELRDAQPFEVVIANILAGPLFALAPSLTGAVMTGGRLILSGLLDPQSPAIEARYRSFGFVIEEKRCINGWTTLTLMKTAQRPLSSTTALLPLCSNPLRPRLIRSQLPKN